MDECQCTTCPCRYELSCARRDCDCCNYDCVDKYDGKPRLPRGF